MCLYQNIVEEREREGDRGGQIERQRERGGERERENVRDRKK